MSDLQEKTNLLLTEIRDQLVRQDPALSQYLERQREMMLVDLEQKRQMYEGYLNRSQSLSRTLPFWMFLTLTIVLAIILADWVIRAERVGSSSLEAYLLSIGQKIKVDRSGNVVTFAAHSILQTESLESFGFLNLDSGTFAAEIGHDYSPNFEFTDLDLRRTRPFHRLTRLELYDTGVSDLGMQELSGFPELVHLDLYNTRITDAAIPHLQSLPKLTYLDLRRTQISEAAVTKLRLLRPECHIQHVVADSASESEDTSGLPDDGETRGGGSAVPVVQ